MANIATTHIPSTNPVVRIVRGALGFLVAAYARQSAYSRTFNELSKLTDRELEDIGLDRGMIPEIARAEADRF